MERSPDPITPQEHGDRSYLSKLLGTLQSIRSGDFSIRMPGDSEGLEGKISDTLNEIVAANQQMTQQLGLVGQVVGREGKTKKRVAMGIPHGACYRVAVLSGSIEVSARLKNSDDLELLMSVLEANKVLFPKSDLSASVVATTNSPEAEQSRRKASMKADGPMKTNSAKPNQSQPRAFRDAEPEILTLT